MTTPEKKLPLSERERALEENLGILHDALRLGTTIPDAYLQSPRHRIVAGLLCPYCSLAGMDCYYDQGCASCVARMGDKPFCPSGGRST